jgi:hypothetical protein
MAKVVRIKVNSKLFNLELDDDFAVFLQNELSQNLSKDNNSLKDLISAYINKNYELFELQKKIHVLNQKLS